MGIHVFLKYLEQEEKNEYNVFHFEGRTGLIYSCFLPDILKSFTGQKKWIINRLKENKEKYADEQLGLNFDSDPQSIVDDKDDDGDNDVQ